MKDIKHWWVRGYNEDAVGAVLFESKEQYVPDAQRAVLKAIQQGCSQVVVLAVYEKN